MPGPCERYAGMPGPEDMELDSKRSRLLVSSQERRKFNPDGSWIPGAIFSQPLKGEPAVLVLKGRDDAPFHPHGISLVEKESLLYVINHIGPGRNAVEVFRVEEKALVFLKRLESPLLHHPNDLVALDGDEFYASNDHGYSGIAGKIEDLFAAAWGEVVHYRKGSWSVAATGIAYANGVQVSPAGDRLFAAGTRDRGIHVYNRDNQGRISAQSSFIDVGTGVDNLMWADSENLIVAGHASIFAFLRHASNAANPSPSEIFSIHVPSGAVTRIFATDSEIHASSTGILSGRKVYIAQVFEPYVSVCNVE